jgi:hypothetical protein
MEATSKNLSVYLTGRVYEQLYYPDIFPVKRVNQLSYETLIGAKGNRVAADVVTYNSSAPVKTRKVISRLTGEIPPIRISREMKETDLNDYNVMKAMGTPDMAALLDLVFGDVDFCVDGVNARIEWLAIRAMAGGSIALSSTNSAGLITETAIDFQMPSANKEVEAAANNYWTTGAYATNTPITDIETIVAEAKAAGVRIAHIVMNLSKFVAFQTSTQVQNYCGIGYVAGAIFRPIPTLKMANDMLVSRGLPTIVVIDTSISLETANHVVTATDPWLDAAGADRYVLFTPEFPLGNTLVGPIAMETNPPKQCTMAKKGHILVSKWSDVNPITEWTMGETNAFISWPTVASCYCLDTESHTTFGA